MVLSDFPPCKLLNPYVQTYRIISSSDGCVNRVLPGTSIALAIRLQGRVAYLKNDEHQLLPNFILSGLRKSVRLIQYEPGTKVLVVLFRPAGAAAFFRNPMHDLFEESISLDNILPRMDLSSLEEQLAEVSEDFQKISIVNEFLRSKLILKPLDELVVRAIQRIHECKGLLRMGDLITEFCLSADVFEKRFRKVTGTSPKQFSMIVRMKHITQTPASNSLMDLAMGYGYFDQSHFNKDFKTYTGLPPKSFFKNPYFW